MKKKMKKIIAVVCAIAMVVSSMTIYSNTTVEAADYSGLEYKAIGNNQFPDLDGTSLKNSQYAFEGESVVINPFQYQDAGMKQLYMAFPGTWTDGLKAVVNGTEIAGNGNQIFIDSAHEKFTYEYNVIEISSNAGTAKMIVFCPNNAGKGTYEGGEEPSSTETTTAGEISYDWKTIGNSNNLLAYDTKTLTNLRIVNENVTSHESVNCIELVMTSPAVSSVTVNGKILEKSVGYHMLGAGLFLHTSALTDEINTVEIVCGGQTARVIIKNNGAKVIAPVMNVKATGGTKKIDVTWDLPTEVKEGTYTVTVKAVLNGVETAGVTVENVEVSKMGAAITSESVMVEGFQIKTNNTTDTVGFRTVCKAPNKGSQIVASDGKTYTVESMGTIYTLDTNYNGYRRNDMLNASYTLLNPTAVSGQSYTYVGANEYDGAQRTFGYVATDEGIAKDWNTSDKDNTYYVRTMNGMSANNMLEYSIHVRAFVVTTDGTIVYGKKTACISVAEVADYLYKNSKSKNFTAHKYLYNSILTKVANTNPYYRDSTLSYGWDSQLFTPANPTFSLTEGTLDALNGKN